MEFNKKSLANLTTEQEVAIINLLNYAMGDVTKYEDLTDKEKSIITEDTFNALFTNIDGDVKKIVWRHCNGKLFINEVENVFISRNQKMYCIKSSGNTSAGIVPEWMVEEVIK